MYKIILLLVKYVKLAILSELLNAVKVSLLESRFMAEEASSDVQKQYWAGKAAAYQGVSGLISVRITNIKGVIDDTRSN